MQGIVFRPGDPRFEGRTAAEAVAVAVRDPVVRHGQPEPGERDPRADRRPARGPEAARPRGRGPLAQRRGRGGRAGPGRLGRGDRPGRLVLRPGLPAPPRREVRLRHPRRPLGPPGRRRLPRPARPARGAPVAGRPRIPGWRRTCDDARRRGALRRPEPEDGRAQGVADVRPRADAPAGRPAGRVGGRARGGRRGAGAGDPPPARLGRDRPRPGLGPGAAPGAGRRPGRAARFGRAGLRHGAPTSRSSSPPGSRGSSA